MEQVYDPKRCEGDGAPDEARQIPLPFTHERRFDAAGFVSAPSNAAARAWLFAHDARKSWSDGRLVVWGAAGRGKTHLLHRWALHEHALIVHAGQRLPDIAHLAELAPRAIALDALPATHDEVALLQIINWSKEHDTPLLMVSRSPPGRWPVTLPDLGSRLKATMAVEVGAAEDILLHRLMLRLLAERQLIVSRQLVDWLLQRLPREACAVEDAVSRIDAMTLASGQPFDRNAANLLLAQLEAAKSVE